MTDHKAIENLASRLMEVHVDYFKAAAERDRWMRVAKDLAQRLTVFEPYSEESADVLLVDIYEETVDVANAR
jgi:hypothetical protein